MVSPDYNLDELFTELLTKVNLTDEEKIKYMHDFDEKSLSEKMVLVKLIEGKAKTEQAQREAELINAQNNKRGL